MAPLILTVILFEFVFSYTDVVTFGELNRGPRPRGNDFEHVLPCTECKCSNQCNTCDRIG